MHKVLDQQLAEELKYMMTFWRLNHVGDAHEVPTKKSAQLNHKIKKILKTTTKVSNENLNECLPLLLEVITTFDMKLQRLCKTESINNLRAINLQENVNCVF